MGNLLTIADLLLANQDLVFHFECLQDFRKATQFRQCLQYFDCPFPLNDADALKTKQKSELIASIGQRLHSLEQANKLIMEVNGRATSATRKQAQQVTKSCGLV